MTDEKNNKQDKQEEIIKAIKKALDKIRPNLQADGGDVEFIGWEPKTGTVQVQFAGMCLGCPMSQITLKQGIEAELIKMVPEVKEVVA